MKVFSTGQDLPVLNFFGHGRDHKKYVGTFRFNKDASSLTIQNFFTMKEQKKILDG